MSKVEKYDVETFRHCEVAGVEVEEGTVLAEIIPKGEFSVADINKAVADGVAEIVPVKATEEAESTPSGGGE